MNNLRNKVQLIGRLGMDPEIREFKEGRKMASFSLATDESYRNSEGEKIKETQWHQVVAWGKVVDVIEKYVSKGQEIALEGKLTSRDYTDKQGVKRYVTEVHAHEVLLLGSEKARATA